MSTGVRRMRVEAGKCSVSGVPAAPHVGSNLVSLWYHTERGCNAGRCLLCGLRCTLGGIVDLQVIGKRGISTKLGPEPRQR